MASSKADKLKNRSVMGQSMDRAPSVEELTNAMMGLPTDLDLAPPPVPTPENAIIVEQDRSFTYGDLRLTPTGMNMPAQLHLDKEDWAAIGQLLANLDHAVQWAIGDWMAYGRDEFGGSDENKVKMTYYEAEHITGYTYQTLRDYAWIARKVPQEARHAGLSFSHHRVVAPLTLPDGSPDMTLQAQWLQKADDEGWSQKILRQKIAESQHSEDPETPAIDYPELAQPHYQKAFKRVWDAVNKGSDISQEDLIQLRQWLNAVEAAL